MPIIFLFSTKPVLGVSLKSIFSPPLSTAIKISPDELFIKLEAFADTISNILKIDYGTKIRLAEAKILSRIDELTNINKEIRKIFRFILTIFSLFYFCFLFSVIFVIIIVKIEYLVLVN